MVDPVAWAFHPPSAASYTRERPLRSYSPDVGRESYYAELEDASFAEFDARLFLVGRTVPCVGWAHHRASQVLVWGHANSEDLWRCHRRLARLSEVLMLHVVGFEYPGYGPAPGKPSEQSAVKSARAVYDYLVTQRGFEPRDVLLAGQSIGAAVMVQLASRVPCGGLLLVSGFSSLNAVVQYAGGRPVLGQMAAALVGDGLRSVDAISECEAPLLVVHGESDEIVPASHGAELAAAATRSPVKEVVTIAGMGHNDVFTEPFQGQVLGAMKRFLYQHNVLTPLTVSTARVALFESGECAVEEARPEDSAYLDDHDRETCICAIN